MIAFNDQVKGKTSNTLFCPAIRNSICSDNREARTPEAKTSKYLGVCNITRNGNIGLLGHQFDPEWNILTIIG